MILLACGGGGGGGKAPNNPPPSASGPVVYYKVGGSVLGLRGTGLKLQLGVGEVLDVEADGAFSFPTPIGNFLGYQVGVISQPSNLSQVCTASNATGLINGADVTNIVINCVTSSFPVRASVSGLEGNGLRLRLQSRDDPALPAQNIELSEDGEIEFPTPLVDGARYELTVAQQPMAPAQWCIVNNDLPLQHLAYSGPVSVACTSDTYRVGGTVFGLRGSGLVLTNNGTDNLQISANGEFAFTAPLFDHTSYEVRVSVQPTNMRQTCSVTNARGSVSGTDVSHVFINCNATQQLGSAGDDEAHAIGLDATSNLYVAGRTNSSLGDATNAGGWDGFVLKLDADGDVQWWRQLGSTGDEAIKSMAITNSGDVYIAGATSGDLNGNNAGADDFFVAKYNTAGDRLWIKQIGTSAADIAYGVDVGPDGSVYVAGATEGELVAEAAAGASDLFVVQLDANGTELWRSQLGSAEKDVAYGLDIDSAGTAYVVGGTEGNLDGQVNSSAGEIGFIAKYGSDGGKQSTQVFCSSNCWIDMDRFPTWRQSRFNSIALDSNGDAYVGGWTSATEIGASQPGNFGRRHMLMSKINASGGFSWARWSDDGGNQEIASVALGIADGELYSVGTTHHGPPLESLGIVARTHLGSLTDSFWNVVSSLNASTEMRAITADLLSNAYAVGFTHGSVDDQPNLGGSDIVIVRYNAAGEKL
jgi:hypothetical protein